MNIAKNALELIGNTPLVRLNRVVPSGAAEVALKLERNNPGGSVKDRPARSMLETALARGVIGQDSLIVEPTSGNTGIGLALACAVLGLRCVITMPASATPERVKILKAYGAEVELTPEDQGMKGAIARAEEIQRQRPGVFIPQQFENPANPEAHRQTTALEILRDTDGQLDAFVATAGTGGTITGTGQVLKQHLPGLHIAVVEPASSPVLSGGTPGKNRIPGLGPGFVPVILDRSVYDRLIQVKDDEALEMTRRLAREEGLLLGPSSGAAVVAALQVAMELGQGKRVVAVAPDTGERYLSGDVFG